VCKVFADNEYFTLAQLSYNSYANSRAIIKVRGTCQYGPIHEWGTMRMKSFFCMEIRLKKKTIFKDYNLSKNSLHIGKRRFSARFAFASRIRGDVIALSETFNSVGGDL
jgi:hypothetical protein